MSIALDAPIPAAPAASATQAPATESPSPATSSTPRAPAPAASGAAAPKPAPAAAEPSWRDRLVTLSGGDKSLMATLERYTDESAWLKSNLALRQKLSAGQIKEPPAPFPATGTDADKAAWRTANGIPDKPEVYVEKAVPPKGVVFGDADKPALDRLAQFASKANWSTERYNETLAAYHHELEAVTAAREAADDQFHQESDDALSAEWGPDKRRYINAMKNMLAGAPEDVRERLMGGRTADGKLIGDDVPVIKWLTQIAIENNPAATILPSGLSATGAKSRLEELDGMAGNADGPYYQAHNAKELQREHLKLLEAAEKMQARGRAA